MRRNWTKIRLTSVHSNGPSPVKFGHRVHFSYFNSKITTKLLNLLKLPGFTIKKVAVSINESCKMYLAIRKCDLHVIIDMYCKIHLFTKTTYILCYLQERFVYVSISTLLYVSLINMYYLLVVPVLTS